MAKPIVTDFVFMPNLKPAMVVPFQSTSIQRVFAAKLLVLPNLQIAGGFFPANKN
jgi:hypothetical protein